jgi:hypothetical protein
VQLAEALTCHGEYWDPCLAFDKVADSGLCHDRNGHSCHDLLDHLWIRHSRHATLYSNVGRYTFQGHDGNCASFLGDACLSIVRSAFAC